MSTTPQLVRPDTVLSRFFKIYTQIHVLSRTFKNIQLHSIQQLPTNTQKPEGNNHEIIPQIPKCCTKQTQNFYQPRFSDIPPNKNRQTNPNSSMLLHTYTKKNRPQCYKTRPPPHPPPDRQRYTKNPPKSNPNRHTHPKYTPKPTLTTNCPTITKENKQHDHQTNENGKESLTDPDRPT